MKIALGNKEYIKNQSHKIEIAHLFSQDFAYQKDAFAGNVVFTLYGTEKVF